MLNLFELENDFMTVNEVITTMPNAAIISPDSLEFTAQESYILTFTIHTNMLQFFPSAIAYSYFIS